MTTTQIQLPDSVTEYVRAVIVCHDIPDPFRTVAEQQLRSMWLDINASPFHSPTGLDWAEIVADWEGDYVHDPAMTIGQILDNVRQVAHTYLAQWETGECIACGAGGWVNTIGKCSDCE